jgi:hypothetical protein
MGSWNRSGVTDNNDAPGDYMIRSEVADDLGEGLCCRLHDLAKWKGKQALCVAMEMLNPPVCQQTFGDRIAARMALAMRDNPHTLAAGAASTADARLNLLRRRRS